MKMNPYSFLLLFLTVTLAGCGSMPLVHHLSPDSQQIKLGQQAFEQGEYQEAEKIFSDIYTGNSTKDAKNTAIYYLASTRLITARNSNEFVSAIELLEEWKASYPKIMYGDDPDILKKALGIGSKKLGGQQQSLRTVVANQKREIDELKQNVQTLQHQIAELEAIDQQIQEKRKPL